MATTTGRLYCAPLEPEEKALCAFAPVYTSSIWMASTPASLYSAPPGLGGKVFCALAPSPMSSTWMATIPALLYFLCQSGTAPSTRSYSSNKLITGIQHENHQKKVPMLQNIVI